MKRLILMRFPKRNLLLTFSSLIAAVVLVAACSKMDEVPPSQQVPDSKSVENGSAKSAKVTFPMTKFLDEFGFYIGFMDPGDVYRVRYEAATGLCILEDIGNDPNPAETVVCSGDGMGFAKCVKDWLEDNVGECLCISYDGTDFEADDECDCPD